MIKQGQDGDVLYLVDSGELAIIKKFEGQKEETHLKDVMPGDVFGE